MNTTSTDLLEQIGKAEEAFTVRRAFGEPFEKDGVVVIPAARVQGAVGGGGGEAPGGEGGTGTGFAMNTKPFGVFVLKDGEVTWRPAVDVNRSGVRGRSDRRSALAGVAVSAEALIFAANGFRCPLTSIAEDLGAESGSVSDIYLPRLIGENLPYITGPVFAIGGLLHARNLWGSGDRLDVAPRHVPRLSMARLPHVV